MEKFRYLVEREHVDQWVNGGDIPIFPAATYLSTERRGIFTPDEALIYRGNRDIDQVRALARSMGWSGVRPFSMLGCTIGGAPVPNTIVAEHRREDALVLCMSNSVDPVAAGRMGKRFCVRVRDVEYLKDVIDAQLGVIGELGGCYYTHDRQFVNHFVKSAHDKWQDEFRIVWPGIHEHRKVRLPQGIAEVVEFEPIPWSEPMNDTPKWRHEFVKQQFEGARIELDRRMYDQCVFKDCTIVFGATGPFMLNGCSFEGKISWEFVGAAGNTLGFLTAVYSGIEGGPAVVEKWFDQIRKGNL